MPLNRSKWLRMIALTAGLFAASCNQPTDAPRSETEILNLPAEATDLPLVPPVMDRAGLLMAVASASSAAALGQDDRDVQRELDGKKFEFRIRFGCPQEAPRVRSDSPAFAISFDGETRTLRIRVTPSIESEGRRNTELKTPADQSKPAVEQAVELVEGFWVQRPWLLRPGCPVIADDVREATTSPKDVAGTKGKALEVGAEGTETTVVPAISIPTIGIAQYFTKADSRTVRRNGRPYEVTKVLDDGERPSQAGYDLVLAGRLRPSPQGRVIDCEVHGFDLPPQCIVSVSFDRVRVERPADRSILAEWS